jgi:hypothetical protein
MSISNLAEYLGYSERVVRRGYSQLRASGFFELIEDGSKTFEPNVYKVLSHKEWAAKFPAHCTVKMDMPWAGEGDPLGTKMFMATGQRVKPKECEVLAIRKVQEEKKMSDDAIFQQFEAYFDSSYHGRGADHFKNNRKGIFWGFRKYLEHDALVVAS